MKPRPTHLLFAALALAALGIGVAALRYLPAAGGRRAVSPANKVAVLTAPNPAGGAILPGLRRSLALQPEASGSPVQATASPTATEPPPVAQKLPPEGPIPVAVSSAAPAETAPDAPAAPQQDAGIEGTVSFPPVAPTPPARPAELRSAGTPLPPTRPRDLALLEPTPEQPAPAQQPQPTAGQSPPPQSPASSWSFPQWPQAGQPAPQAADAVSAPVAATVPTPPVRPVDLNKLAALAPAKDASAAPTAVDAAQSTAPAAAPATGSSETQVARLQEPALRPAPDDAFQAAPPIFGMGDPVFVRIFKQEGHLELWLKKNGRFALYKTFPICKWSGRLGPKQKEADYQSPEGFYSVSARQLNPHSNYYRAFNVGYPNAFDRQNGRTGGLVMVHGACKSVGCFAMTDRGIEEIYGFVEAALRAGQKEIPVHIFPFRMTEANITRETGGGWMAFVGGGGYAEWAGFWHNLKQGYDLFEQTGEPPVAFACGDHYEFDGGSASCRRVAGW